MSPGKHDVIQATVRFIDAILCRVYRIIIVGVSLEGFRVYDLVGELAADDKGITHNVPLTSERIGQSYKNQDKAQAGGWTYSDPNR